MRVQFDNTTEAHAVASPSALRFVGFIGRSTDAPCINVASSLRWMIDASNYAS
ncbi:hypothetical protein Caka_0082 [Coraliomargarita akajimensis DSM 45221]|uniref:Uncharacterized protein n=1 Tax=Coraliomargarita akajimensis (strain DSM 45221 / IAM 15411 / JCM 23193 / KCTC 12865 / 04OKA010-24) TaxID=583355 RepID=D5EL09_CORAD|nr:hypothetical protein Caka_0082 [Coraliomargarita akajimensis DSM 45221]